MNSFYTSLEYMELLEISGEDNGKFLQGQLTCDIDELSDGSTLCGAACNTNGRVYSNFRIFRKGDAIFLSMQPGMLSITLSTLGKYIPFYKAEMIDASEKYLRIGLAGKEVESLLSKIVPALPDKMKSIEFEGIQITNLSGNLPRYELWVEKQNGQKMLEELSQKASFKSIFEQVPAQDRDNWEALDYYSGLHFIHPGESNLYTPEELNLDLTGFVSFEKGCYTGQEIVARMHYRGKANKRLHAISVASPFFPIDKNIYNELGKVFGTLINPLNLKDNSLSAFTVIKSTANLDNCYCLDKNGEKVPVKISPIKYPETF